MGPRGLIFLRTRRSTNWATTPSQSPCSFPISPEFASRVFCFSCFPLCSN